MYSSYHDPVYHDISVFTGNGNRPLAEAICSSAGLRLGSADVFEFSNENIFVKINESVREHDCFVIQPTCSPVNRSVMELLIMIDALKRASAGRVTAIIPYYAYGRSDKKDQPRVPITGRLIADLIITAGAHRVLTMDLHQGQIQGFFSIPVDELTAIRILCAHFIEKHWDNAVVVCDLGYARRARDFADLLKAPLAIVQKRRIGNTGESQLLSVIGEVGGRRAIIVDDEIDRAGTLMNTITALEAERVGEIYACCTHAVLSGPAMERIQSKPSLKEVVVTDTIPVPAEKMVPKLKVLSVAPLLGEAIKRIHTGESVGVLFR